MKRRKESCPSSLLDSIGSRVNLLPSQLNPSTSHNLSNPSKNESKVQMTDQNSDKPEGSTSQMPPDIRYHYDYLKDRIEKVRTTLDYSAPELWGEHLVAFAERMVRHGRLHTDRYQGLDIRAAFILLQHFFCDAAAEKALTEASVKATVAEATDKLTTELQQQDANTKAVHAIYDLLSDTLGAHETESFGSADNAVAWLLARYKDEGESKIEFVSTEKLLEDLERRGFKRDKATIYLEERDASKLTTTSAKEGRGL